jgi:hypothetical protein
LFVAGYCMLVAGAMLLKTALISSRHSRQDPWFFEVSPQTFRHNSIGDTSQPVTNN